MRLDTQVRDQDVVLLGGGLVLVDVGRDAALHLEEVVGVAVDLVGGSCGEADHQGVEVLENRPVLLEYGAVGLVNHDKVEMRRRVHACPVLAAHRVDGVEDGRVGGEHDAGVPLVPVPAQVAARGLGQVALEGLRGLVDERHAVGEEEHVLHAPRPHEHVCEPRRNARLAGTRGHDEQALPVPFVEVGAGPLDGLYLVVAVGAAACYRLVHLHGGQRGDAPPPGHDALQVVSREDATHLARSGLPVVDEHHLESVGQEDERAVAELVLQAVRVQAGLLQALLHGQARALGLEDGERSAVLAVEQVVDVSRARVPRLGDRHPMHFPLDNGVLAECPAREAEVPVDVALPRLVLRDLLGVELAGFLVLGPCGGKLFGGVPELPLELLDLPVLLGDEGPLGLDGRNLRSGEGHALRRDLPLVEGPDFVVRTVAVVDPVDEVEEGAQREHGVRRRDALVGVDGEVAQLVHAEKRPPDALVHALLERILVEQRGEVVLVRHADGRVRRVDPLDGELEGLAAPHRAHRGR